MRIKWCRNPLLFSNMNVDSRPVVEYPKEPDTIDASINHLLSLYSSSENIYIKKNYTVKKKPLHTSFQHRYKSWLGETTLPKISNKKKRVTFSKVVTIINEHPRSAIVFEGDIYVDAVENIEWYPSFPPLFLYPTKNKKSKSCPFFVTRWKLHKIDLEKVQMTHCSFKTV